MASDTQDTALSSHTPRSPLGWRLSMQPAELHSSFQYSWGVCGYRPLRSLSLGLLFTFQCPTRTHSRTSGKSGATESDSESEDTWGVTELVQVWGKVTSRKGLRWRMGEGDCKEGCGASRVPPHNWRGHRRVGLGVRQPGLPPTLSYSRSVTAGRPPRLPETPSPHLQREGHRAHL